MSTPDKQAAPSEWVERAMVLVETYAGNTSGYHHALRIDVGTHEAGATCVRTEAALRAHLEAREALVEQLAAELEDAATSLETVARLGGRTHYVGYDGERIDTYMGTFAEIRHYAQARAGVARAALAAYQEKT